MEQAVPFSQPLFACSGVLTSGPRAPWPHRRPALGVDHSVRDERYFFPGCDGVVRSSMGSPASAGAADGPLVST